ncbi:peptidylprolyl isomerase [Candidatus Pelagibacter sp.]|uniref:peptidylprolyl isomerase n=1 Tax=Candidatus Pelagibacter sp. TaxID=2024849 RepID=UPI003F851E9F
MENKILLKIDNEIITSVDIFEEIKFLKIFNPEANNLSESELFEISKNSILRDIIKKIEIMNFVDELKVEDKFLLSLIKRKYLNIEIDSFEDFENYLNKNNLNVKMITEKFTIEIMWNDLVYQKFNKKIIIDKDKIEKEILQNPQKDLQKEILLSEIVFSVNNKDEFKDKYEKILLDIENMGFKKTALIHSNSDTASNGGLIGWVKKDNLNKSITKIISDLQPGQLSKPIRTSSGFIMLKLDDEREQKLEFNLNDKIQEVIRFKRNEQLNQFSNMYFNKLKKNLMIYGL